MFLQYLFYFGWGAGHALQPGHGKAIISAYLLGASQGRRTPRAVLDTVILGVVTALTHTVVVFAMGIAIELIGEALNRELVVVVTSIIGSVLVIGVGVWMLRQRIAAYSRRKGVVDHHGKVVADGGNEPGHDHDHEHDHGHHHHHDEPYYNLFHSHSHKLPAWAEGDEDSPDRRQWKRLLALGVSGGIVPCKGAMLILFGTSAAGSFFDNLAEPLIALSIYSLGIAATMIAVGLFAVFFSKAVERMAQKAKRTDSPFWIKVQKIIFWGGPATVLLVGGYLLLYSLSLL